MPEAHRGGWGRLHVFQDMAPATSKNRDQNVQNGTRPATLATESRPQTIGDLQRSAKAARMLVVVWCDLKAVRMHAAKPIACICRLSFTGPRGAA